ncbi:MAG: hypothetical protein IJ486_08395 [Firmicutes bacterium]|nr:hypothetical protein [Bacillota bacterium]
MNGQSRYVMRGGRLLALLMAVVLVIGMVVVTEPAHAAVGRYIKISQNGGFYAAPGDREHPIEVTVRNSDSQEEHTVSVKLGGKTGQFTVQTKAMNVTLAPGEETKMTFHVDIARALEPTSHSLVITAEENGEIVGSSNMHISLTSTNGTYEGLGINYALDNAEGLVAGTVNDLKFEFYNRGSIYLRDVSAEISRPDGITINNAAATANLGYLSIGDRKNYSFPLRVDSSAENTNYPIQLTVTAKVKGVDGTLTEKTFKDTFYISVVGGNSGLATKNLTIGSVSAPTQTETETDFTLAFTVKNNGTVDAEHLKIDAEIPSGLLNKTTSTFVENRLAAGQSKDYQITLMATNESKDTTYPIKISVSSLEDPNASTVMQYTSIYVKSKGGSANVSTPRLMVDTYDYGGGYVKAGDEFKLNVGLMNTSARELGNIKVTVSGGDTFVPVGSSNAFFVDSIEAKGHYVKTLRLRANASAEQSTATLSVRMEYEDMDGDAYTAEDTISIPLVQDTRLEINDVSAPWECYVGSQGSSSVEFYNMGKTTLNNLRVTAEGNFDTMESNSYYVGNMSSGSTDDFSFSFIPREAGPMEGKVIFTYEDASGQEQVVEKTFVFEAMEMPVWDEPMMDMPMEEPKPDVPWKVIAAVAVVGAAVGFVIRKKHKKKKLHEQLEMEDE